MEKDKIIILKNRGVISIFGSEAGEFLQNIITNDINKVTTENSILWYNAKEDFMCFFLFLVQR